MTHTEWQNEDAPLTMRVRDAEASIASTVRALALASDKDWDGSIFVAYHEPSVAVVNASTPGVSALSSVATAALHAVAAKEIAFLIDNKAKTVLPRHREVHGTIDVRRGSHRALPQEARW